ncbi:hypothetical protein APICC_06542 [Apis cerana cerana]|uniref:Uncharacterized protein n=1 Tax=Apis cerana cerana TaxID=94128 RepID=A0A2A3ET41_APICC|nr:hypothetical protein APICC_06542 [Apis cerana cerana]
MYIMRKSHFFFVNIPALKSQKISKNPSKLYYNVCILYPNVSKIPRGEKLKPNIRRASGLLSYPRIGRSNAPVSNLNFNRRGMESDTDFQFYSAELDQAPDKDYEDSPAPKSLGRSMHAKHADRIPKEASWLISDRPRSSKDGSWKIDEGRSVYPAAFLLNSVGYVKYFDEILSLSSFVVQALIVIVLMY